MSIDYPVICLSGTHLDEECAAGKQKDYREALKNLAKVLSDKIQQFDAFHQTQIAACSGDPACVANVNATLAIAVHDACVQYQKDADTAFKDYKMSLLDCCVKNAELTIWDWITGWF